MFDIIFPGSTRPISPYNIPVVSDCEATHAKLREFIESDKVVEAVFMGILGSLTRDNIPETRPYLREAVRKGLHDLVEVHRCASLESAVSTDQCDDDKKSPNSFNSLKSSPSVYLEEDTDPSDLPYPAGGELDISNYDLPSMSIISESFPTPPGPGWQSRQFICQLSGHAGNQSLAGPSSSI